MKSMRKRLAVATAVCVSAASFVWSPAAGVGAATANFICNGISGDSAATIGGESKSSAELLKLLASLGGTESLPLAVNVTPTIPASVKTGSGAYSAAFEYEITLPDSLVTSARDLLKVTSLNVTNATFGIDLSGAATGTITGTTASVGVSLASSPVIVRQSLSGTVTPSSSGIVYYRPGATTLSVVVNATVDAIKANIGTITVSCSATGLLGSTTVKPQGSPNISPNPIVIPVKVGSNTTVDLSADGRITPDDGNPITWSSLKLLGAATGGTATLSGTNLSYTAPATNGQYDVSVEICAAAKTVKGSPGNSEIQAFVFNDARYYNNSLNAHPLYFTLVYDGQETAPIYTSYAEFFGTPVLPDPKDPNSILLHALTANSFRIPTPAAIQSALEALPNIAPGDVTVSGGPTLKTDVAKPYVFTFAGNLANKDVPQITLGKWETWLPNSLLTDVLNAASALGGAGGGATPPTYQQSFNDYLNGVITYSKFEAQVGERFQYDLLESIDIDALLDSITKLFPKVPGLTTSTTGESPIADTDTGPLCSQGVVQFLVTGAATTTTTAVVQGASTSRAAGATATSSSANFAG
jgi:hypothetical protein